MDLKSQATVPTLAAEVIAGNPDPVMRTITIDRGSADGVQPDMAVIAPGGWSAGLSARSRSTRPASSRSSTATRRLEALSDRTRAGGMVVGGGIESAAADGAGLEPGRHQAG